MKHTFKRLLIVLASVILAISSVPAVPLAAASSGIYFGPMASAPTGNASVQEPRFVYSFAQGETVWLAVTATSDYKLKSAEFFIRKPGESSYSSVSRYTANNYYRYEAVQYSPAKAGTYGYKVVITLTDGWEGAGECSFTVNAKSESADRTQTTDTPTVYNQTEAHWKKVSYADRDHIDATVYSSACGVFAFANCVTALTGKEFATKDIEDLCSWTNRNGYRASKSLADSSKATDLGVKHIDTLCYISTSKNAGVIQKINDYLNDGCVLYFSVKSSSGGHIMSILGIRTVNGKTQYLVADSYPTSTRLGKGVTYGWCTMDSSLDLTPADNSSVRITTKGGSGNDTAYGFWVLAKA